jgi:hypothetical protein
MAMPSPAMSALQQGLFCGLEKPGFPYPADACQGPETVPQIAAQPASSPGESPPAAGGVILLRSVPMQNQRSSSTVVVKIRTGSQYGK